MGYTALLGAALAAVGTGVSIASAQQAQAAMNRQVEAGIAQQEDFQKKATPIFNESLQDTSPDSFNKAKALAAQKAQEDYQNIGNPLSTGAKSPLPIDTDRLNLQVDQTRKVASEGEGYKSAFSGWNLKDLYANSQLNTISGLASSNAQTNNILTTLAGNSSAGMAGIGSLMSTAGGLAMMYGAVNAKNTPPPTPKLVD
jgi:hypothetical protein